MATTSRKRAKASLTEVAELAYDIWEQVDREAYVVGNELFSESTVEVTRGADVDDIRSQASNVRGGCALNPLFDTDGDGYPDTLEREFPEGASEPPQGITRRTMLTLLGASASLAGLSACRRPVEKIVPYVSSPEEVVPGVPNYYATTMPLGHSALGLVVESHEGRPTKVEGNRLHPSTAGSSDSAIQASITLTWEDLQLFGFVAVGQ